MKLSEMKIGKLNIIDLSIVLIVILFIGVYAFAKISSQSTNNLDTTNSVVQSKFKYTILIESLSGTSSEMFKIGDELFDKVSNVCIGKIVNLEVTTAKGLLEKSNGEIIEAEMPGKIDVKLDVETNGSIKNGEYLANDLIRIMVGSDKQIKTKYVMCSGTLMNIEK